MERHESSKHSPVGTIAIILLAASIIFITPHTSAGLITASPAAASAAPSVATPSSLVANSLTTSGNLTVNNSTSASETTTPSSALSTSTSSSTTVNATSNTTETTATATNPTTTTTNTTSTSTTSTVSSSSISSATTTTATATQYLVVFQVNPDGAGSTNPSGNATYATGSMISISATASSGYAFSGWSVENSSAIALAIPSSASTSATINGVGTITANFNPTIMKPAATQTVVSCNPTSVPVSTSTTCTATVTSSVPLIGQTVSWGSTGSGIFNSTSCALDGTCTVTYTPTAIGRGTHTITGKYVGDVTHLDSTGNFSLTVTPATMTTTTATATTPTNASGTAKIWTNKLDYLPGEIPTIYGTGFLANANITISVTRPEGTVNMWFVTADGSGGFTTTYVTSGLVFGTFTVTATDGTNTATTTFTDAPNYDLTVSYRVLGGGSPTAPVLHYCNTGGTCGQTYTLTTSAHDVTMCKGSSCPWSVTPSTIPGSSGEQWVTFTGFGGPPGPNCALSGASPPSGGADTCVWQYSHQWQVSFAVSPSGGGATAPTGTAFYNDTSISGIAKSISATATGGYTFSSWTVSTTSGSITVTTPSSVSTTATIHGTGTITANFVIITIRVDNRTLSTSSGGANITAPQNVNPTVEYWYGAGLYDSQYTTDIQSIAIDLYRTGHAAGSFDKSFVYSFRWVANGWGGTPSCSTSPGCWQELQSSGWVAAGFNYLVSTDSSATTISGSVLTAKWQFAVKLDQLAVYTTNGAGLWNFKVTIVSKSSGNPSGARAGTLDVNLLISITVLGNMDWGTVAAGSVNVTASGMPVYTTYTANAIVSITVYGSGDPTSQYGDSFPLSYIYVGKTNAPANNDGVALSASSKVFYSSLPVAANSNLPMYWFISTPNPFTPGSYTFTYYETIQLQSMQP